MFVLTLEYISHAGNDIWHHIPAYQSLTECEYWRDWFLRMLEMNQATVTKAVCEAL